MPGGGRAGGRCVKCAVSRVQRSVENVEGGTGILISLIRRSLNCSPEGSRAPRTGYPQHSDPVTRTCEATTQHISAMQDSRAFIGTFIDV